MLLLNYLLMCQFERLILRYSPQQEAPEYRIQEEGKGRRQFDDPCTPVRTRFGPRQDDFVRVQDSQRRRYVAVNSSRFF